MKYLKVGAYMPIMRAILINCYKGLQLFFYDPLIFYCITFNANNFQLNVLVKGNKLIIGSFTNNSTTRNRNPNFKGNPLQVVLFASSLPLPSKGDRFDFQRVKQNSSSPIGSGVHFIYSVINLFFLYSQHIVVEKNLLNGLKN